MRRISLRCLILFQFLSFIFVSFFDSIVSTFWFQDKSCIIRKNPTNAGRVGHQISLFLYSSDPFPFFKV